MDYIVDQSDPPFICTAWDGERTLTSVEIWDLNLENLVFEKQIGCYSCILDFKTKSPGKYYLKENNELKEVNFKDIPIKIRAEFALYAGLFLHEKKYNK